jgi:hypothetical protein
MATGGISSNSPALDPTRLAGLGPTAQPEATPRSDAGPGALGALGAELQAGSPGRPALQASGSQALSVESPASTSARGQTQPLPNTAAPVDLAIEGAFVKFKELGDKPVVKALNNLVTGEGHAYAKFDEALFPDRRDPKTGKLTSPQRDFNTAKALEIAGGVGWGVRQGIAVSDRVVKGLAQASKYDALKSSVRDFPVASTVSQGVGGTGAALAGVAAVKQDIELVRDTILDAAAAKDRSRLHELLVGYDVATGHFKDPESGELKPDPERKAEIESLVNKKGGDRSRSHLQATGDRVAQIKDATMANAGFASGILLTVGKDVVATSLGKAAANVVPGLGIAVNGLAAANATWKAATNFTALNNVRMAADQAKGDPLFAAVAAHVSQERIYNSRKHLLSAATNATGAALSAAALAAGPGAPAGLAVAAIVSTSITTAAAVGTAVFDVAHSAQLASRRKDAGEGLKTFESQLAAAVQPDAQKALWANLAKPENIGVAERALMTKLRNPDPQESAKAVKFLEDFGLTKQTINKLKVMSDKGDGHLKALQQALYVDKVTLSGKGAAYTFGSFGRVIGVVQLASTIRNAYQRFAHSETGLKLERGLENKLYAVRDWARDKLGDKADTGPFRNLLYTRNNPLSRIAQGTATPLDHAWVARHREIASVASHAQAAAPRPPVVDAAAVRADPLAAQAA